MLNYGSLIRCFCSIKTSLKWGFFYSRNLEKFSYWNNYVKSITSLLKWIMQRLNHSDHLYSAIIWWKSNFASLFVYILSDFLIISRNILPRAMVNFSPSVGWCHPICMLYTDLFRDPEQHPISRLYLRNDLLALCILVWETDIYFHFDIWTTEHTSGILAGRDARSVLADAIGRHHI